LQVVFLSQRVALHAGAEQRALDAVKLAHAAAECDLAAAAQFFFLQIQQLVRDRTDVLEQGVQRSMALHALSLLWPGLAGG
jgi:hypothetical protein